MTRSALTAATVILSFLAAAPPCWAAWTWPLRGEVITPYRNGDDPYAGGQHRGIDIGGDVGAPVLAATPGEVRFAGTAGVSGLTVSLRTADGRYDTSYLHLSAVAVRKGDTVSAGEPLGAVGTSGSRSAVAPHLHFGVRDAGTSQAYHDPLGFLPPLATTGQPQPGTPSSKPEAVPSAPSPQPVSQPAPIARPAPGVARVPRTVAGRVRGNAGARARRGERAPSGNRAPARARAPRGVRGGAHVRGEAHVQAGTRTPHDAPGGVPARAGAHTAHQGSPAEGSARDAPVRGAGEVRSAGTAGAPGRAAPARHPAGDRAASAVRASGHVAPGLSGGAEASPSRGADASGRAASPGAGPGVPSPQDGAVKDTSASGAGRPDAGWALACLGLLLAAALVGTSGGGRDFVKRRGAAVGRAVRPLLGRG